MVAMKKLLNIVGSAILLFSVVLFAQAKGYQEIMWDDLMPPGWEPEPPEENHEFIQIQIPDAPVVLELNDKKVKIPGFMLPTKQTMKGVTEFLLVPYLGACIHVPPPPGNQMVFVTLDKPYATSELYDPVWVSGSIMVENKETEYATASYSIRGGLVEAYLFE